MLKVKLAGVVFVVALSASGMLCRATNADTVTLYSQSFDSSTPYGNLNGLTPQVTTGGASWSASGWVHDTGSAYLQDWVGGTTYASALLPFVPGAGKVYTLTIKANTVGIDTSGTKGSGAWEAYGFVNSPAVSNISWDNNGAVAALRMDAVSRLFTHPGPNFAVGYQVPGQFNDQCTFQITLDTTPAVPANWTYAYKVTQAGSGVMLDAAPAAFGFTPSISYVGFGNQEGYGGVVNFTLTATTVPEPSVIALLVSGLIGLLAYAWRKRR